MMTPELFSDRGVAWVKAIFDVCNQAISNFGILAAAAIAVWQNLKASKKAEEAKKAADEHKAELDARLDRQADRINSVALSVPTVPEVQKVDVVNTPTDPVPVATQP